MVHDNIGGTPNNLKDIYTKEANKRESLISDCELYAGWTLPTHFPTDDNRTYEQTQYDYQSVGAQAVLGLSSKLVLGLFPPNRPFFRSELTESDREALRAMGQSEAKIDEIVARTDRNAQKELNKRNSRSVFNDTAIQLIITGNALLEIPKKKKGNKENYKMYTLRDYVVRRDLKGDFKLIIICETKAVSNLEEEYQLAALAAGFQEDDEVSIYTGIRRVGNKYHVTQELEDICECHNREGIYNKSTLPFRPLTWSLKRGQNYGTGLVENYAGDFHTLSNLAEAKLDWIVQATDVKMLVNPTGLTNVEELAKARSGDYVRGREEDVTPLQFQAFNALQAITAEFEAVSQRINKGFLSFIGSVRNQERVTKEEIQRISHEVEQSLGGVYSKFAEEWQLPVAQHALSFVNENLKNTEPTIITGIDALSRTSQLEDVRAFLADLAMLEQIPEQTRMRIDDESIIAVLGAGHGVEYEKFLKSQEDVDAEQEAAMQQQAQLVGAEEQAKAQAQQQI